ncbi:transcription termination/antitermination protein NusG [Candidatus Parcubacteria bacterium]|nr:MAG: transcription termination/antitermination protein NusG [Candidatus Parcubacteria bacterium]
MTNSHASQQHSPHTSNTASNSGAARQWYAVHTYSGYEEAVARYLKQRVESLSMGDKIFNVVVPKEKKVVIKRGKRQTVEEKTYPGYVLVEMILTEDSWYVVRNTPRVTGFVGSDPTHPAPLAREEVEALLRNMGKDETAFKVDLRPGDLVRIIDGPFRDYDGKVAEVDEEKGKVKVLVPVFGRDTAVELDFLQVKKV